MDRFLGIRVDAYKQFARNALPLTIVLLLFFGSGACGLIYQVVWTRKLVLLFGTTAYAISTVLSVFFLGLGLGSLWGGRLADRVDSPLRAYGVLEVLIGLWAILFIIGIDAGEAVVAGLLRFFAASRVAGVGLRAILAVVFLLAPVTMMGATLPLLSKALGRADATRGRRIALLYGLNTIGAIAGCLFAGFYGIEHLGYSNTTFLAAAVNVGIGMVALLAHNTLSMRAHAGPATHSTLPGLTRHSHFPIIPIAFACSGFCTLALEVLWTRLLTLMFMGTTYAYSTMLASILTGIALGSLFAGLLTDRTKSPVFAFGVVECIAGLACFGSLILVADLPEFVHRMHGWFGFDFQGRTLLQFTAAFLVLLIPTFFFGMTFPLAVRASAVSHARLGSAIGLLYGANTLGGVLGAVAGGYVLLPMFGAHQSVLLLGALLMAVGVLLVVSATTRTAMKMVVAIALLIGVTAVVLKLPADASRSLNRAYIPGDHRVIAYREGVEGTVVVSEPEANTGTSNRALWINSVQATQSIRKGIRMNRFQGVLPFVFNREPKSALMICFGSGITAGTLASSSLTVTGVELSRDVLGLAHLFETDNWGALENPNLNVVVDDGRNFLLTHPGEYDIITFEPMPLAVAGVSTFYSSEFYALCRSRLAPSGIVVQWMPLHGTNLEVVRALTSTFYHAFPECSAWFINADLFLVGSVDPLTIDYANAEERMKDPLIADGLRHADIGDLTEFLSCYFMSGEAIGAFSSGGDVMSDDRPWVEFVVPRTLQHDSSGASLEALLPFFENPVAATNFGRLEPAEADASRAAMDRRFNARAHTLRGIQVMYQSGPVSDPERHFEAALDIDPNDFVARSYYQELAPQRMAIYLRWEDFARAEEYLDRYARYLPDSPDVWRFRGDLHAARNETDEAEAAYRKYSELTGTSD